MINISALFFFCECVALGVALAAFLYLEYQNSNRLNDLEKAVFQEDIEADASEELQE